MSVYIVLLLGFALSYLLYVKFGIRAPGVIAAPLLAIYTLENPWILLMVVAVSIVIYGISYGVYKKWFVYGRRLLLIMCVFSVVITTPIIASSGFTEVVFITILPALFAYNLTVNGGRALISIGALVGEIGLLIGIGILLEVYL